VNGLRPRADRPTDGVADTDYLVDVATTDLSVEIIAHGKSFTASAKGDKDSWSLRESMDRENAFPQDAWEAECHRVGLAR
jgi:hypothetical protein